MFLTAQGRQEHTLPPIDHHPKYNKPESSEDWDTGTLFTEKLTINNSSSAYDTDQICLESYESWIKSHLARTRWAI